MTTEGLSILSICDRQQLNTLKREKEIKRWSEQKYLLLITPGCLEIIKKEEEYNEYYQVLFEFK